MPDTNPRPGAESVIPDDPEASAYRFIIAKMAWTIDPERWMEQLGQARRVDSLLASPPCKS
jgi:hypothetical protein